jgi:two-component system, OmpR family, response regulator
MPKDSLHILVVDDDQEIRELLTDFLKRRGMRISSARDSIEMQEVLSKSAVDLVILDVMLPGKSGMDICRELRMHSRIPVIMLTAIADTTDRVVGLEMGADDYITKPFDPRELLARIHAVLRRGMSPAAAHRPPTSFAFGGWTLDCARHTLLSPEEIRVELTTAEFNLLEAMVKSANHVLSRDRLMELTSNDAISGFDRSIDIMISRLRRKLGDNPRAPSFICTVRSGGYQFLPNVVSQ